jgi:hypothetical protein
MMPPVQKRMPFRSALPDRRQWWKMARSSRGRPRDSREAIADTPDVLDAETERLKLGAARADITTDDHIGTVRPTISPKTPDRVVDHIKRDDLASAFGDGTE